MIMTRILFIIMFILCGITLIPVLVSAQKQDEEEEVKLERIGNMVKIQAGIFWMGNNTGEGYTNETPYHPVYLDSFYIDMYEVMNMDYVEFLNAEGNDEHYHPIMSDDKFCGIFKYPNGRYAVTPGREDFPVTYVTWEDANAYAKWCGKRLPTEAEWEKAARGGLTGKKFPYGNYVGQDEANYTGRAFLDHWDYTSPVGGLRPNNYGLHDMCGNVWEWVQDLYSPTFYKADTMYNPVNDPQGNYNWRYRVIRGGSWIDENGKDSYLRVSCRGANYPVPENWTNRIGFRCASSVPPSKERQQQAGLDFVAQKMKKNNPELYGNLSLDSLKSLISIRRTTPPVFAFQSNIKSIRKAMTFSLFIPGTGEFYTGRWFPGLFFLIIEGASWSMYLSNTFKASDIDIEYRSYAEAHYSVQKYTNYLSDYQLSHGGKYPPSYVSYTLPRSKTSDYYTMISTIDQFMAGWDDFDPFTGTYGNSENRSQFLEIRKFRKKQYNDYKRQARNSGLFIIGNHVLSLIDTIWGTKRNTIYRSKGWSWNMDTQYYNYTPVPNINFKYKW